VILLETKQNKVYEHWRRYTFTETSNIFCFHHYGENLCSLRTHLLILVLYQSCTKSTWKFITMHLCLLLINPNWAVTHQLKKKGYQTSNHTVQIIKVWESCIPCKGQVQKSPSRGIVWGTSCGWWIHCGVYLRCTVVCVLLVMSNNLDLLTFYFREQNYLLIKFVLRFLSI